MLCRDCKIDEAINDEVGECYECLRINDIIDRCRSFGQGKDPEMVQQDWEFHNGLIEDVVDNTGELL